MPAPREEPTLIPEDSSGTHCHSPPKPLPTRETENGTYHQEKGSDLLMPIENLRFLNKACIVRNPSQDLTPEGRARNPWNLCIVEEVEDLKALVKLSDKESVYCSDASISRYLMSRNSNVKKVAQMLKQSLKWRKEFKPEEIRWEDVAADAESGLIYRPNYQDKYEINDLSYLATGMKRKNENSFEIENSKSTERQVKHFVHCFENAILNLPPHKEQLVWLVDLEGIKMCTVFSWHYPSHTLSFQLALGDQSPSLGVGSSFGAGVHGFDDDGCLTGDGRCERKA
ncbi:Protein NRT1/ PTR FAMILY 1.1 [Vigna angularis]|uniref:Protein NRT1/ PTR FAMILY 1.1 n=1 Tax=Phaseolus angularis TaxID=3914 RepID=A0A8T0KC48_PHAAN|nr:Protein NRT1/ PTR FAMILY 1.1 [Vigna angularis]